MKNLRLFTICFVLIFIGSNLNANDSRFVTKEHLVLDLERQIEWLRCSVGQDGMVPNVQ